MAFCYLCGAVSSKKGSPARVQTRLGVLATTPGTAIARLHEILPGFGHPLFNDKTRQPTTTTTTATVMEPWQHTVQFWKECAVVEVDCLRKIRQVIDKVHPVVFLTGRAHLRKTTGITFWITRRKDTRVVCVEQTDHAVLTAYDFTNKTLGHGGTIAKYNHIDKSASVADAGLVYMTCNDVVLDFKADQMSTMFKNATHIVLAYVHEQSINQELACWLLARAELRAIVVMVTSYPESGALNSDCAFLEPRERAEEYEVLEAVRLHLEPSTGQGLPAVSEYRTTDLDMS